MNEIERILNQYDREMNGKAWHGDPVWKILDGVSAEQAARRAQVETHSIWELVSHMTFWETEMCRRLGGRPARSLEGLSTSLPLPRRRRRTGPGHWQSFGDRTKSLGRHSASSM